MNTSSDGVLVDERKAPGYTLRAVERTIEILNLLATVPEGLTLGEVSKALAMPRSTVFRYMTVLEQNYYVDTANSSRKYRLGLAFLRFQEASLGALAATARTVLEPLRDHWGETINLGVLMGTRVLYVEVLESARAVRLSARRGDRERVHSSALGKAISAKLPENEIRAILEVEGLPRCTDATICDVDTFLQEVANVRRLGYATDIGESEEGACCVGVALDLVTAPSPVAISYSCPVNRFQLEDAPAIARALREAGREMAEAIDRTDRSKGTGTW